MHLENCISKIEKTSFENHEECRIEETERKLACRSVSKRLYSDDTSEMKRSGIEQRIVSIPNEK